MNQINYTFKRIKHKGYGFECSYTEIKKTNLHSQTLNRLTLMQQQFNIKWENVYVTEFMQKNYFHDDKEALVQSVLIEGKRGNDVLQYYRKEGRTAGSGNSHVYLNGYYKVKATTISALLHLLDVDIEVDPLKCKQILPVGYQHTDGGTVFPIPLLTFLLKGCNVQSTDIVKRIPKDLKSNREFLKVCASVILNK